MKKTLTLVGALICAAARLSPAALRRPDWWCVGTSGRKPECHRARWRSLQGLHGPTGGFDDKSFNQTSHKCMT